MLTQERLKELLHYDEETGVFTRAKAVCGTREPVGKVAGTLNKRGYFQICIDYKIYTNHRLAWLYKNGSFPDKGLHIDHIDRNKLNNSYSNLRVVTHAQNFQNRSNAKSDNLTSKTLGVCWYKRDNTWQAEIAVDKKRIFLGRFKTLEEAENAYIEAKKIYHPYYFVKR